MSGFPIRSCLAVSLMVCGCAESSSTSKTASTSNPPSDSRQESGSVDTAVVNSQQPATPPETPSSESAPEAAGTVAAANATAEVPPWRKEVQLLNQTWAETKTLIESFRGKVVVVDVWSTACEPCLREFPHLVTLQEQHPEDLVCIGLNCDYAGVRKKPPEFYRDRVMKTLNDKQAKIVNVMCTEPADELFVNLKIDSIPAVFVYDREGHLISTFDNRTTDKGEFTYTEHVLPAVDAVLKGQTPAKNP